jgi:hypothetical protein
MESNRLAPSALRRHAPGTFRFDVEAIDPGPQGHSPVVSFEVSIRPPWWRTRTFYLCLAVLSFLYFLLFLHLRERRLIKRQPFLEKLVAQRTSELEAEKSELLTAREALHHKPATMPSPDSGIAPQSSTYFNASSTTPVAMERNSPPS